MKTLRLETVFKGRAVYVDFTGFYASFLLSLALRISLLKLL